MIISARQLAKTYGDVHALRGLDLDIAGQGIVGILGPNGAGKTTFVEIVEGLRERSSGTLSVLGMDPSAKPREVKERVGVQLQSTTLPQDLTCREVVTLFAAFYQKHLPVDEVLGRVDLEAKAGARVRTLSGGQAQRLALALALLNDPELLILDEPTAGLDPVARRALHEVIRDWKAQGRAILLTTHYIEEAELLCDRVIMFKDGRVVADGSPLDLVATAKGSTTLWLAVDGILDPSPLERAGATVLGRQGDHWKLAAGEPTETILAISNILQSQKLRLIDMRMKRPTLEDVYLELIEDALPSPELAGAPA